MNELFSFASNLMSFADGSLWHNLSLYPNLLVKNPETNSSEATGYRTGYSTVKRDPTT